HRAEVERLPPQLDAVARPLVDAEVATHCLRMGLAQPFRAEPGANFLVGGGREDQVSRGLEALPRERCDRDGARSDLSLHVERTAPPDLTVAQLAAEWVRRPLGRVREHDVRMREEQQPRTV